MSKTIPITSSADLIIALRNTKVTGVRLCAGTGATGVIEIFDGTQAAGTSIAKLSAVANESAPPLEMEIDTTHGISATISGSGAKAWVDYE